MPRSTRNQEPGNDTRARRPGQDAGTAAVADREPAGRARRSTGTVPGGATEGRGTPGTSGTAGMTGASQEAARRPGDGQPRQDDPSFDDIARRAYELYQERGGQGGQDVDDWLRAEQELRGGGVRREDEV